MQKVVCIAKKLCLFYIILYRTNSNLILTAMEMVSPNKRLFAGTICQMFFSLGYMLTALWAYLIRDWRDLQIALTVPGLVFFCYWW